MSIKCVIDSSTLISLSKIEQLELLKKLDFEVFCPQSVYREAVEAGLLHGHYESIEIKKLVDNSNIKIRKSSPIKINGISRTDTEVINLALIIGSIVLANDTKLSRKAVENKLLAFGSPDLLLMAKERNIISKEFFISKIKELASKKRLSAKTMEEYLR